MEGSSEQPVPTSNVNITNIQGSNPRSNARSLNPLSTQQLSNLPEQPNFSSLIEPTNTYTPNVLNNQPNVNSLGALRSFNPRGVLTTIDLGRDRIPPPHTTCYPAGNGKEVTLNFLPNAEEVSQEDEDEIDLNSLPERIISGVTIGLFTMEEMQRIKVCDVYDPSLDSRMNTINDPRMGSIYSPEKCPKCGLDSECPGHYGLITFNSPIYHPEFIRLLVAVMNCICIHCGTLLLSREAIVSKGITRISGINRLLALEKQSKGATCRRKISQLPSGKPCEHNPEFVPSQSIDKNQMVYRVPKKKGSQGIQQLIQTIKGAKDFFYGFKPIEEVITTLNFISREDADLMGFTGTSHPKSFIMEGMLVIPPISRTPDIQRGVETPNGLTVLYSQIVRENIEVAEAKAGKKKIDPRTAQEKLFSAVKNLMDSSDAGYPNSRGGSNVNIKNKIQGKGANIRGDLMGKRSNFSARVVIGPANVPFGKIRLPMIFAPILTKPMIVFQHNIEVVKNLLAQGRITHITPIGGKHAGKRIKVRSGKNYTLHYGDKVNRWLQDGDFVVFNRQPTLHKYSMMAYEVVLSEQLNIGLHLSNTPPHNADQPA